MKITEIKIRKTFDEGKFKAIASVVFDNCLVVHDIKVIDSGTRKFVAMPSRIDENGIYRDIVPPILAEIRGEIEAEILDAYERYVLSAEINRKMAE